MELIFQQFSDAKKIGRGKLQTKPNPTWKRTQRKGEKSERTRHVETGEKI